MWPGADAGSSVLLEWIHALVAGLAGAIYREHKPADLRSAGQRGRLSPHSPSWLQHEHGSSTSEDARAYITLLFAQTSCNGRGRSLPNPLPRRRIRLEPDVQQGSLPPSAPPTPDRFRWQWRPESPLCARSGPLAGQPGPTGWPIASLEAPGRGPGRRLSLSVPLNSGGLTLLLRPLRWLVRSSQCSCALFLRLKCPAIQVSAAD